MQNLRIRDLNLDEIASLIKVLRDGLGEINVSVEHRSELESDVVTIETQLKSPNPKSGIIKECISSLKRILEGATGGAVAAKVLEMLAAL